MAVFATPTQVIFAFLPLRARPAQAAARRSAAGRRTARPMPNPASQACPLAHQPARGGNTAAPVVPGEPIAPDRIEASAHVERAPGAHAALRPPLPLNVLRRPARTGGARAPRREPRRRLSRADRPRRACRTGRMPAQRRREAGIELVNGSELSAELGGPHDSRRRAADRPGQCRPGPRPRVDPRRPAHARAAHRRLARRRGHSGTPTKAR